MNRADLLPRVLRRLGFGVAQRSWAQCGEDLLISFALSQLGVDKPFYLDIGAHHATQLSNTYFFYRRGAKGINVEANPALAENLARRRSRDITVNSGVVPAGTEGSSMPFYVMALSPLSTFSAVEADRLQREAGVKLLRIEDVPVATLERIVEKHAGGRRLDLLSIDIEGWDERILRSLDYSRIRPLVICAETIDYHTDKTIDKNSALIDFICRNGYFVYADTYINTIFIDSQRWPGRIVSTLHDLPPGAGA